MSIGPLTYDALVTLARQIEDEAGVQLSADEIAALQCAHIRVRDPRHGVTPGGIEWRSAS